MRVVALILAGGAGTRLGVLSEQRAKPAVPFAGRFRIIDFTLSNCVNSGIYDVGVLTQYLPRSLNDHIGIGRPWDLDRNRGGVRLLQPYQGSGHQDWYGGTADAVLQNLDYLRETRADTVVILSGDHIYKMDYGPMLRAHEERRADLTVAVMNVQPDETSRFGIVLTDEDGRVTRFLEKPKEAPSTLANMGVYVFNVATLIERMQALAKEHPDLDFGKHVIPSMVESHRIYTYPFDGYWVDVGTVDAYWSTSMELVSGQSQLNLYDPSWVIHTKSEERAAGQAGPAGRRAAEHDLQRLHRARAGEPLGAVAGRLRLAGRGRARERHHERHLDRPRRGGGSLHRGQERRGRPRHAARLGRRLRHAQRRSTRIGSTPARPSSARGRASPAASASAATW